MCSGDLATVFQQHVFFNSDHAASPNLYFLFKKICHPPFFEKWRPHEVVSMKIHLRSTCWMLCTAELVSVSSPTMTVLNSAMGGCLGSGKSVKSSDSESSGSTGTLCFFLECREDRMGFSWDMLSFSKDRVGCRRWWFTTGKHEQGML